MVGAGIMPIMTYQGFKRMTGFCKTYVPPEITERLEEIKDDDEAVKLYGIELGTQVRPAGPPWVPTPGCDLAFALTRRGRVGGVGRQKGFGRWRSGKGVRNGGWRGIAGQ